MTEPRSKLSPENVITSMCLRGLICQTAVGVFTITEKGRAAMKPLQEADLAHKPRPAALAENTVPGGRS